MRALDPVMAAELPKALLLPGILAQLSFKSKTEYVWTGVGSLVWNGNTFLGVGAVGSVGPVSESSDVHAEGTSVKLSGIALDLLSETLTDIQLGASATLWLAFFLGGAIIGTPYRYFGGTVDKPTLSVAAEDFSVALALENKLVDLARASMRRYTAADQRLSYADDIGFNWVEILNDIALRWHS